MTLRMADFLGARAWALRWLDHVNPPAAAPRKPDLSNWANRELSAVWIGHATMLLRLRGLTILIDPVFSNRIGVGLGLVTGGPRRLVAPASGSRTCRRWT